MQMKDNTLQKNTRTTSKLLLFDIIFDFLSTFNIVAHLITITGVIPSSMYVLRDVDRNRLHGIRATTPQNATVARLMKG